jgi:two-component system sensor histidine kinase KdpD
VAQALIDYAVKNNVTKIVVGKPTKPRWREFLQIPLVDQIIRLSGTIDVYVVSIADAGKKPEKGMVRPGKPEPWSGYMKSLALILAASAACELVRPFLAPTNLVMIYLLAVVLAATRLGLKPAIMTAFLSVLAFDFFFVPPRLTFAVTDTQYLLTFVALFTVGVVISTLVSQARERAEAIRQREAQTSCLYYLSRDLAAAGDVEGILQAVIKNVEESLEARLAILLAEGDHLHIKSASHDLQLDVKELAVADWSFRNRMPAGRGTETLISAGLLYLPLQTTAGVLGVFGIKLKGEAEFESPEQRRLFNAFAAQAALAIERVQLVKQAEQAQILQAREGLERALLNSISHDLRTPLVSIIGALDTLRDNVHILVDGKSYSIPPGKKRKG